MVNVQKNKNAMLNWKSLKGMKKVVSVLTAIGKTVAKEVSIHINQNNKEV